MSINKTNIAVGVMAKMIALKSDKPVSLAKLSETTVSVSYLEQIFAVLRKAGLVVSTRGPGGGYTAAKDDITVGDVVRVFTAKGFMLTIPVLAALDSVLISDLPEGFSL